MSHKEIILKLQEAIFEVFEIEVSIAFSGKKICIKGVSDKIDELKVYLFVLGYLHAMKPESNKLKIFAS